MGYGRRMFDAAISYIRRVSPGAKSVHLNVNRYNKALSFYKHLGMRILTEGDFALGNGYYMNDYIMCLDLQ